MTDRASSSGTANDQHSADDALSALPDDLVSRLAILAGGPEDVAEIAISLLPFGYRSLLKGWDIIEIPERQSRETRHVQLTRLGMGVVEACGIRQRSDPDRPNAHELDRRAEALLERLGGPLRVIAEPVDD